MRGNKSSGTRPELAVRHALWAAGRRYRVNCRPVPSLRRSGDLVFTRARLVIFIDGCFWHGCPEHYVASRTNLTYWQAKIEGNRLRDVDTDRRMRDAGWRTLRFWTHEPVESIVGRIAAELDRTTEEPPKALVHTSDTEGSGD